jgi:hypothetical protein
LSKFDATSKSNSKSLTYEFDIHLILVKQEKIASNELAKQLGYLSMPRACAMDSLLWMDSDRIHTNTNSDVTIYHILFRRIRILSNTNAKRIFRIRTRFIA